MNFLSTSLPLIMGVMILPVSPVSNNAFSWDSEGQAVRWIPPADRGRARSTLSGGVRNREWTAPEIRMILPQSP